MRRGPLALSSGPHHKLPLTYVYATLWQSVANLTFRGIIFHFWFQILPPVICEGDRLYLFLYFPNCNYQQVYTYPLLLFLTFSPQAYSLLEHYRRMDNILRKLGQVETRWFPPNPTSLGREGVFFPEWNKAS